MSFTGKLKSCGHRVLAAACAVLAVSGGYPALGVSAAGTEDAGGGDVGKPPYREFTYTEAPELEESGHDPEAGGVFYPNVVSKGGAMPFAGGVIGFWVYGHQPEMSTKTGAYLGGRCAVNQNSGQYVLPMKGWLKLETKDSPSAAAKTFTTYNWTYGGTGVMNVTPFIHTNLGEWKPAATGLVPTVNLSGDTRDATSWLASFDATAAKGKVYGRVTMYWAQNGGSVSLDQSSGTITATSSDCDADGWMGLPYTDVLKNAYMRLDNSAANTAVTAATATRDVTNLVDNGAKPNQHVYTDWDNLQGNGGTHTDQAIDFGTVTSAQGSFSTNTDDAGKYLHVTFTTWGGNTATKTVQIPPAYRIIYDSQGGSAVDSSSKVFSGYNRSVTEAVPVRDGYKFLGWYTAPNAGGLKREAGYSMKMTSDITLYAAWKVDHQIKTEVVNGTITESMEGIDPGTSKTITYRPDSGYRLKSITVDGRTLSASEMERYSNAYTFSNIQGSHSIKVVYGKGYDITTIVENGWIDDSLVNVEEGSDATIEYGPDDGCRLKRIQVDGVDVSLSEFEDMYTFENITQDHTIKVIYSAAYYVDTYVENGTITEPDFAVDAGNDKYVEYSPDDGYVLESIMVDGVMLTGDGLTAAEYGYLFSNVQEDHEIRVIYAKEQTYTVTVEVVGGTTTTPEITDIKAGGSARIRWAKASAKHQLVSVTVNGVGQDLSGWRSTSYQFKDVREDKHVVITFEGDPVYQVDTGVEHGTIDAAKTGITAGGSVTVNYSPEGGYRLSRIEVDNAEIDVTGYESSYTFTNVRENHSIYVVYEPVPTYSVTTHVEHGTITETKTGVLEGDDVTVTYTPEGGYVLESVTVDGNPVDVKTYPDSYAFTDIHGNHDISVVFVKETTYSVETSVVHGTITESKTGIRKGTDVTIAYAPEDGYRLRTITVDGTDVPTEGRETSYTFTAIGADHAIRVVFEQVPEYTVETSVEHGTVTPTVTGAKEGTDVAIQYSPDEGYELESVTVDGTPVDKAAYPDSYTFAGIAADHTIHVVFKEVPPNTYDVTTSVEGGTITPSADDVEEGTDVTVEYTPDEGYELESVTVDGTPVDIEAYPDSYPFLAIDQDHTIHVVFKEIPKKTYNVTTSVEHGTITPSVTGAEEGADVSVEYSPDEGYVLESVTVDGTPVDKAGHPGSYTFAAIAANHTIHVVFKELQVKPEPVYSVTTSVEHGVITPSMDDVEKGSDVDVKYAPDAGYELESVTVDGIPVDIEAYPDIYTFPGVDSDHTIHVVFKEIPKKTYSVTTSVEHGTVTPSKTGVEEGTDVTIEYAPEDGYILESVAVDGTPVDIKTYPSSYVFTAIAANHTIHVVYVPEPTYKVETSVEHGTVTPTVFNIKKGTDVEVTYAPEDGYRLGSITVDGVPVEAGDYPDSYTFSNVTQDHTIRVVFVAEDKYSVTTSVEGGTITPSRTDVREGEDVTVEYAPEDGNKYLEGVTVDGEPVDITEYPDTYTFPDVDKDHTVHVVYKDYLEVTTEAEHGTISGPVRKLKAGSSADVTYSPEDGYHLGQLFIDGEEVSLEGHGDGYHFQNLDKSHHVKAVFVPDDTYTVTATVEHGTITGGKTGIRKGETVEVTYVPEGGYHLQSVTVDGKDVDIKTHPGSYIFANISGDHTIHVVYAKDAAKYKVDTKVTHGTIMEPKADIPEGTDVTITYSPDDGYVLDKVLVDGEEVDTTRYPDSYPIPKIDKDHVVEAVFKAKAFTVKATVEGGTISGGREDVAKGEDVVIAFSPDAGNLLENILIDGVPMDKAELAGHYGEGADGQTYTFGGVDKDHTIHVVYGKAPGPADNPCIEIRKTIADLDAVVRAKGGLVFQFRIDGYDKAGNRHTYYRTLTVLEGQSTARLRLEVPYGGYHVTELPGDGWDVADTTQRTQTVEVKETSDGTVPVVAAEFINRVTDYQDYTGNCVVANELKK